MPVTTRPTVWSRTRPMKLAMPPKRVSATKSSSAATSSGATLRSTPVTCKPSISASTHRRQHGQRHADRHFAVVVQDFLVGGEGAAPHQAGGHLWRLRSQVRDQQFAQLGNRAAGGYIQLHRAAGIGLAQRAEQGNRGLHAWLPPKSGLCKWRSEE